MSFTVAQYRALAVLASGGTVAEAANESGSSVSSINKWKNRADFKTLLNESGSKVFDAAITRLTLHSTYAVNELCDIVYNPDVPIRTKLQAITTVLSFASNAKTSVLEARLQKLEDIIHGTNGEQTPEFGESDSEEVQD